MSFVEAVEVDIRLISGVEMLAGKGGNREEDLPLMVAPTPPRGAKATTRRQRGQKPRADFSLTWWTEPAGSSRKAEPRLKDSQRRTALFSLRLLLICPASRDEML